MTRRAYSLQGIAGGGSAAIVYDFVNFMPLPKLSHPTVLTYAIANAGLRATDPFAASGYRSALKVPGRWMRQGMEKSDSPARTSPGYSAEDFIHPIASLREAAKAGGYAGLAYFLDMCLTEATIQADAEARKISTSAAHRPT